MAPGTGGPQAVPEVSEATLAADALPLARLAAATFPLACPPGSDPEDIRDFIAANLAEEHFAGHLRATDRTVLWARDAEGRPVGYCLLVRGSDPAFSDTGSLRHRPTVELNKFYVLPDHHGLGTSTRLMAAALEAGRRSGARGMWLGVNQENVRARRFYAKSGYTPAGERTFRLGRGIEQDFILERAL